MIIPSKHEWKLVFEKDSDARGERGRHKKSHGVCEWCWFVYFSFYRFSDHDCSLNCLTMGTGLGHQAMLFTHKSSCYGIHTASQEFSTLKREKRSQAKASADGAFVCYLYLRLSALVSHTPGTCSSVSLVVDKR